ncbi:hypothetical protein Taro_014266 [Colocasia esculenta]|uniref:Bifunctional inhibitor/plant lipid transfer protein/seed storage helical domain-containing protein n=1 Tax=Colocasia esculenta TaxID=4460 RepID=A0A843UII8_COLES|nr:hypothetical protein [Colocasia esculenta]
MAVALVLLGAAVVLPPQPASAQVVTSCTSSMISSFTPCLNFLTGSSNGGSSPTADCCDALGGLLSSSTECTCLILTGNVPISLPINRALAISLPRACKSKSIPLFQCKGSATRIPPPGPIPAGGPSLPALPPFPTSPSVLPPPAPPVYSPPAAAPSGSTQPGIEGLRPLFLPNSAVMAPRICGVTSLLVPVAIGVALLSRF